MPESVQPGNAAAALHHPPEDVAELGVDTGAGGLGVAPLDLGDDLVPELELLEAAFGRDNELGAAIARIRLSLDVPDALELIHEAADDLLVAPREPGELGCPDAVFVEVSKHRAVARVEVRVPLVGEAPEQFALQGALETRGENPEIRVQLLPLAASLGRGHDSLNLRW